MKDCFDIFVLNPWTEFDSLENLVGLKKLNVHQITAGDFLYIPYAFLSGLWLWLDYFDVDK